MSTAKPTYQDYALRPRMVYRRVPVSFGEPTFLEGEVYAWAPQRWPKHVGTAYRPATSEEIAEHFSADELADMAERRKEVRDGKAVTVDGRTEV